MLEFLHVQQFYLLYVKRFLDFIAALAITLLLLPLLVLVALLIRLDSPGSVIFIQKRLGWRGSIFNVYKFRTMKDQPRKVGREIVGHDPDVTKLGFWLRRFKVDELPQLFNIIKGDMSFIGPRPAMPEQMALYDDFSRQRLLVRPGLSGLAQVSGNIHLTWPERWQYDVQYVDGVSFLQDVTLFFRTLIVILVGEKKFLRKPREKK